MFENMLDRPRGNMLPLLTNKERSDNPIAHEFKDVSKGVIVNKNNTNLFTFSLNPNGMFIKIHVLNIHSA